MNKYEKTPEYIVDLHGYTTREAGEVLEELIEAGEYRHVRVITGKGDLHDGPVLRTYVMGYLKKREIKFQTAKISNGGEGALEVFLK
jgi:DNA-nicking Smr family endonuclease